MMRIRNKGLEVRLDPEENIDTSVVRFLFPCQKCRELNISEHRDTNE